MTIDVVRTDVLLWILGGFADGPVELSPRYLPVAYVRELKRLASKPRCDHGEVKEIADRYGRSPSTVRAAIHCQRHAPQQWWRDVA